jgi:hypothetical protein
MYLLLDSTDQPELGPMRKPGPQKKSGAAPTSLADRALDIEGLACQPLLTFGFPSISLLRRVIVSLVPNWPRAQRPIDSSTQQVSTSGPSALCPWELSWYRNKEGTRAPSKAGSAFRASYMCLQVQAVSVPQTCWIPCPATFFAGPAAAQQANSLVCLYLEL